MKNLKDIVIGNETDLLSTWRAKVKDANSTTSDLDKTSPISNNTPKRSCTVIIAVFNPNSLAEIKARLWSHIYQSSNKDVNL